MSAGCSRSMSSRPGQRISPTAFAAGRMGRILGCCLLLVVSKESCHAHGAYHDIVRDLTPKIARDPDNVELRVRLLAAHVDHDEWKLALEEIGRIEKLAPGKRDLGYFKGRSLAVAGRWNEAVEPLTAFLDQHPAHEPSLAWRARSRNQTGDVEGANADFAKACAKTKEPGLITEYARSLVAQDLVDCASKATDHSTALEAIAMLQRIWPRPEIWMRRKAVYLSGIGRDADSIAAWKGLRDHIMKLPNIERAQPFLAEMLGEARMALGEKAVPQVVAPPAGAS
jgi:tetratricopeptide (TPR) repeat protein